MTGRGWCRGDIQGGIAVEETTGLSQKETTSTGMIGQSSGRVMWLMPLLSDLARNL